MTNQQNIITKNNNKLKQEYVKASTMNKIK
jgi:hypothetical protein